MNPMRNILALAGPVFLIGVSGFAFMVCAGLAMAQSGGLSLPEDGGPLNGTAQAGSAALARDAQTSWTNHAGMTRLEATEVMLTFQPLGLNFEFQPSDETAVSGTTGGNQGGWVPGGALFFATPLSERTSLGFSVTSPSALVLNPEDDWVGRYFMTRTQLVALNIEPSFGIELGDQWALGAGIDIQYATFEQEIAVRRPSPAQDGQVKLDGDSWQVGFSLSTLFEAGPDTRLGLRYRSLVSHELTGDLEGLNNRSVTTGLAMPQSVTFSGYHQLSPATAMMVDIGWQDWSTFDRTRIVIDGETDRQVEISRNFVDTWTFSIGAHHRVEEKWLLMAGFGFTSAGVDDVDRTPDMPVDEQWRISAGVEMEAGKSWRVGGNYTYLNLGSNAVDATLLGPGSRVEGDFKAYAHTIGLYGSKRF